MAIVLAGETGFVMTEQLPCLKLNGQSITPENDIGVCLYMTRGAQDLSAWHGRATAQFNGP